MSSKRESERARARERGRDKFVCIRIYDTNNEGNSSEIAKAKGSLKIAEEVHTNQKQKPVYRVYILAKKNYMNMRTKYFLFFT